MAFQNINIAKTKTLPFPKGNAILFISYFVLHTSYLFAQNALINEKSLYLRQHAHNPVNWQAWSNHDKNQDKLLIISIGYAACHWCHVMEQESFSDTTIARLMNQHFVNIKIDREERPDIDKIYMTACQLTHEQGCGWPLNVIALPDGKPVWIGSYLSKKEWQNTLTYFLNAKKNDAEKLRQYANQLKEGIKSIHEQQLDTSNFQTVDIKKIIANCTAEIDVENGGVRGTPKFPIPSLFDFLLLYEYQHADNTLKNGILNTLNHIAKGGLYDHLEGGFARYSTDVAWNIPHFEKMLYDNALMVSLYARAYHVTKDKHYQQIVQQTIRFLEQSFKDKSGGFYSSIDADTDGKEGQYYKWTRQEIEQALGKSADVFFESFSLHEGVLIRKYVDTAYSANQHAIQTLLSIQKKRTQPTTDTKIITAWNALMLKGYVDAYRFLGDEQYREQAEKLGNFIAKQQVLDNQQLKRLNYQNTSGFLDDYAYTIEAFIALYQVSFDIKWLHTANQLANSIFTHFEQNSDGLFNYATENQLFIHNSPEIVDGILPSSNAVLANALHDLGILLQNDTYLQASNNMVAGMNGKLNDTQQKTAYYYWGKTLLKQQKKTFEVCIIGKNALKMAKEFQHIDNILLMASTQAESLPLLKFKYKKGKTMIYVCQNHHCKMPTENTKEAMIALGFIHF
jgi:uncharacterized protein